MWTLVQEIGDFRVKSVPKCWRNRRNFPRLRAHYNRLLPVTSCVDCLFVCLLCVSFLLVL